MNVLHITTSTSGGAGVACIRLHQGLLHTSLNSSVLCLKDYKNIGADVPHIHEFKKGFLPVMIRKGKSWLYDQKLKSKLKNQLPGYEYFSAIKSGFDITRHAQYKKADIIHLHWVSGFLDFESFFLKNTKPVVWTLHDMFPFTGGCHHADDCQGYKTDCNHCPQLKGCPDENFAGKQLGLKKTAINYTHLLNIVTPSSWLHDLSSTSSLFSNFFHSTISNGIDENIFCIGKKTDARKKLNLPQDKKIILFAAGSITNFRKGSHILIDAVKKLKTENAVLVAAGKTNGLAADLPIIRIGEINNPVQMASAYQAADVFVLPSLAENLPNTIAEAMLCGIPAIGFNVGGVPEMIINGKTGFLCNEINATNLASTIDRFFIEKNTFNETAIRNFAVEKYSLNHQSGKYKDLYNKIINQVRV